MANEITITTENFDEEVKNSDLPVLVDFWAEWCMPCKMVAPVLEEISTAYEGKLKVGKLDVDQQGDLAMKFNVQSIPTLLLFKGGEVVARKIGAAPRTAIEELFTEHI